MKQRAIICNLIVHHFYKATWYKMFHVFWQRKEWNVLFNDALHTFYLWLYDIRHMVKDHSNSKRGNLLPPHSLLFLISSNFFYMHHPTERIAHTMAFVTPVVEHWLEQEIAQWVYHEGSILQFIAPWADALTTYQTECNLDLLSPPSPFDANLWQQHSEWGRICTSFMTTT